MHLRLEGRCDCGEVPQRQPPPQPVKRKELIMKLTRYIVAILIGCVVLGCSVFGPGIGAAFY